MSATNIKISPSLMCSDFARLLDQVAIVEAAGADYLHIDVMDGHFVPNITMGPLVCESLKGRISKPLDVHLMISEPDKYAPEFAKAGAHIITVHAEATLHLHRSIQLVKSLGVKVGVALNPASSLSLIEQVLPEIDLFLLMTVNPGFGGQSFIASVLPKIKALRTQLTARGLQTDIEVDGGINVETAKQVVAAGANVLVAGNAIFKAKDPAAALRELRRAVSNV